MMGVGWDILGVIGYRAWLANRFDVGQVFL